MTAFVLTIIVWLSIGLSLVVRNYRKQPDLFQTKKDYFLGVVAWPALLLFLRVYNKK